MVPSSSNRQLLQKRPNDVMKLRSWIQLDKPCLDPQRKLHQVQRVRCLLASQRFRLDIPLRYLTSKDMIANRALTWPKHFTLLPYRIKHGNGKSPTNGAVLNGKNIFHEFSTAMFDYRRLSLWKPARNTMKTGLIRMAIPIVIIENPTWFHHKSALLVCLAANGASRNGKW